MDHLHLKDQRNINEEEFSGATIAIRSDAQTPIALRVFVRLIGKLPDNVIARPADDAWLADGWKHEFDNRLTTAVLADMLKTLFVPGI